MQTSNTEEMVTISRAEYERLQQEKARNAKLEAKLAAREQEQAQVITSLTLQNEWLLEQLKLSKKKLFGRSSEQAEQMVMDQLSLTMNEVEAYIFGMNSAGKAPVAVKAHERKRQFGNVLDVVPEGTPTEVVEHRLPENERICSACGNQMVEIGKEVRRSLMMKPAEFWVREDVYYTYACKNCEQETGEANIVKVAREPALLPGSFASAEAVAYLAAQKFVMYSPLYRLEQEFNRQGLKLSRQTMANWLLNTSEKWLRPVYDVLREQLCRELVLHADETTLQVLKEPGRSSTSKSYMWLYRTSGCAKQAVVLYEYQPTRKAEHAETFLRGFNGWLHADGYQGYHKLPGNIRVVGCWAHARRKFDEALQTLPKEMQKDAPAAIGECYCSRLFRLEQAFAELTLKERYDVTTVSALTTGTYNARLTYRILYKTNYNDYRVLASNLLSTNNYSFGLSGLQLMAGEVVTDIYFDFGTVPSGFQSVTKPTLMVSVNPRTANKYYVTNRADAGGKFGETWQSANASWITIVRNLTPVRKPLLPKTGY